MASMNWGVRRAAALVITGLLALAASAGGAPAARAATASGAPVAQATEVGSTPTSRSLSLVLPLSTDKAGLAAFAQAVSTPGSPQYGQFESITELVRRFGAPAAERARVIAYLRRAGARDVSIDGSGLFADATMSAGLAHRLFGADLANFRTATAASFTAPTNAARVPAGLAGAVTGVVGLDTASLMPAVAPSHVTVHASPAQAFGASRADAFPSSGYPTRSGTATGCPAALAQQGFAPNQYLTAYGYEGLFAGGYSGAGERVALIEINGFKSSDVRTYAACFGQHLPPIHTHRVGIRRLLAPGGEATLDLEVLDSAAPYLSGIDVYESTAQAPQILRAITRPLSQRGAKPDVISVSLGDCERDTIDAIGAHNMSTIEASLQMAAASGTSVLASSGDDGSSACVDDRGLPKFERGVNFPASSPWVTGVGGTQFYLNAANQMVPPPGETSSQIVWNDDGGAGGGGYSLLFRRPAWQNGVSTAARRVVPDVSMLADPSPGYAIYCSAHTADCVSRNNPNPWTAFGGTSAATPLLAGGLADVDGYLRATGHRDLGLANPVLYDIDRGASGPSVFDDVTQFSNDFFALATKGADPLGCCTAGPGFDPASGLGSVNIDALAGAAAGVARPLVSVGVRVPRQRHPVASRRVLATLSCSGRCLVGAVMRLSVGGTLRSASRELRRRGRRTVAIGLGGRALRRVRAALHHHQRVYAAIYAVLFDQSGAAARVSAPRLLRLR